MSASHLPSPAPYTSRPDVRRRIVGAVLWAMFAFGLLLQLFAPRLKIENNAFVIPPALGGAGKSVAPGELVARERKMRALSATVTLAAALSLAFHYRAAFVRPRSS